MTESLPSEGLKHFSEALNQRYGSFMLQPFRHRENALGHLKDRSLRNLTICKIDVEDVISRRAKLPEHLQDFVFVLAPLSGEVVVDQYDRISALGPGDLLILDSRAACSITVEKNCSAVSLELNRSMFNRFGGVPRENCARKLDAHSRAGGLSSVILTSICSNMEQLPTEEGDLIGDLIVSIVGQVTLDGGQVGRRQPSAALIRQMRDWVRANVQRPDLGPDMLARQFGLSRRSLYRHFIELGITPARWLWDIRLECAEEILRRSQKTITEIAYSVGFNDSSHFSRLYKTRYGRPPTARYRAD